MTANRFQTSLLQCASCNARGALTWELADVGIRKTVTSILGEFHIESDRIGTNGRTIICTRCDEIHETLPAGA